MNVFNFPIAMTKVLAVVPLGKFEKAIELRKKYKQLLKQFKVLATGSLDKWNKRMYLYYQYLIRQITFSLKQYGYKGQKLNVTTTNRRSKTKRKTRKCSKSSKILD